MAPQNVHRLRPMSDRWKAYDAELLSQSRRDPERAEEPEAAPPKKEPLVAQGPRSRGYPQPRMTPDALLRSGRRGEVWRPIG